MYNPKITILSETTKYPIDLIGKMSGECYGADTAVAAANYKRGINNIKSEHDRCLEFPTIIMKIENISAKVAREFYTHIVGNTRLQSSTRYIAYENFPYIIPPSIEKDEECKGIFESAATIINESIQALIDRGIPKEDAQNLLPLAYSTVLSVKMNARSLKNMSRMRMCARAYPEFQLLMDAIIDELSNYSIQWAELIALTVGPRCQFGVCPESKNCPKKDTQE